MNEGISSNRATVARVGGFDETGEPGWSIGNEHLFRTSETSSWSTSTNILMIAIKGTALCDGIWCAELTVKGIGSSNRGCAVGHATNKCSDPDILSEDEFTYDGTGYTVTALRDETDGSLELWLDQAIDDGLVFHVDDETFNFADADVKENTAGEKRTRQWNDANLSWSTDDTIHLKLTEADTITDTEVPSNWSLTPSGLAVGDQFRLLFLSSTKTDATSTGIEGYNTFIQDLAEAGHADIQDYSAGFRAVGCTADVDARDNTGNTDGAGVPIYWLNGSKAADDYGDFYDGDWDDEANDKNESGNNGPDTSQSDNRPFTGCDHDGTELTVSGGSRALGANNVRVGRPNDSGANSGPLSSDNNNNKTNSRPMYGLSQVFEVVSSTDATLSGLGLEDSDGNDIPLDTDFASDDYEYEVSVANDIDAVKLTATKNDSNATVVITDDDDVTTADEAELDLSVGSNTLTVTVTAEDTSTELTYTVNVERAGSSSLTTLVRNTHLNSGLGSSTAIQAQSIETGANAGGYTVFEVDIYVLTVAGSSTSVSIREDGGSDEPGELVATLTNPGTLTANSINTFTASPGITLEPSTTYWIIVNEALPGNRANIRTVSGNGQTGEPGWKIGNGRLFRTDEISSWTTSDASVMIEIRGTSVEPPTLVSNTHLDAVTGSSDDFHAQRFETGANATGYTVTAVDVWLLTGSSTGTNVSIKENNSSDEPGDLVATLANPGTFVNDSLNRFTASADITLDASTSYWVTINEGISSNRASVRRTLSDDQTGEPGWTIGDSRLYRSDEGNSWNDSSNQSLLIAIRGASGGTTNTDAEWAA